MIARPTQTLSVRLASTLAAATISAGLSSSTWIMGLGKTFPVIGERLKMQLRGDAFNVFNHPNFITANICTDITNVSCLFGTIAGPTLGTSINNDGPGARVLQVSLRIEF